MTLSPWTIKISPTRLREEWKCALCGAMFTSEDTLADLFDETGEHQGVVCPACLAAGPEAAQVRLELRGWGQGRTGSQVKVEMPMPARQQTTLLVSRVLPGLPLWNRVLPVIGSEEAG